MKALIAALAFGHADCCPDVRSVRERSPDVPGELLIRIQRLLTDDKARSATEGR